MRGDDHVPATRGSLGARCVHTPCKRWRPPSRAFPKTLGAGAVPRVRAQRRPDGRLQWCADLAPLVRMVDQGVTATSLSGVRRPGCGGSESAGRSLGTPRRRDSVGAPPRTGGSGTMHKDHVDWSVVVTALAVLGILTFLFLH